MDKQNVLNELENLIVRGEDIISNKFHKNFMDLLPYDDYNIWVHAVKFLLLRFLDPKDDLVAQIRTRGDNTYKNGFYVVKALKQIKRYIENDIISFPNAPEVMCNDIGVIFDRFHRVANSLRERRDKRTPLEMKDEYDVQYLLEALLNLYFDEVLPEVWTPYYAGKCSRVDFFIRDIKTVIEVKRTRTGLSDGDLGDQLIVDVERYKCKQDCEQLICFVYDPEYRIKNANAFMNDLNNRHNGFLKVIIKPEL